MTAKVTPLKPEHKLWANPESVFVCQPNDAPPPQRPRRRRTPAPDETPAASPQMKTQPHTHPKPRLTHTKPDKLINTPGPRQTTRQNGRETP